MRIQCHNYRAERYCESTCSQFSSVWHLQGLGPLLCMPPFALFLVIVIIIIMKGTNFQLSGSFQRFANAACANDAQYDICCYFKITKLNLFNYNWIITKCKINERKKVVIWNWHWTQDDHLLAQWRLHNSLQMTLQALPQLKPTEAAVQKSFSPFFSAFTFTFNWISPAQSHTFGSREKLEFHVHFEE